MQEREIEIVGVPLIEVMGVNNERVTLLRRFFPRLKILTRGNRIQIVGEDEVMDEFEVKISKLVEYLEKFQSIHNRDFEAIMMGSEGGKYLDESVVVYGNGGAAIRPKSKNQKDLVDAIKKNDLVFAIGPAGTGKTYLAVAMAVRALKNKEVKRIVLTRPAVEAGENLGFLPGDLKEKLDPYLQPLYDGLRDMIPAAKLQEYFENGVIEIAPLAFMRGRTLSNSFVILDEAQNSTETQIKMFLTRMGLGTKFVVTGDHTQVDLPTRQKSGLLGAVEKLDKIKGVDVVYLSGDDGVRHPLVKQIIAKFES